MLSCLVFARSSASITRSCYIAVGQYRTQREVLAEWELNRKCIYQQHITARTKSHVHSGLLPYQTIGYLTQSDKLFKGKKVLSNREINICEISQLADARTNRHEMMKRLHAQDVEGDSKVWESEHLNNGTSPYNTAGEM
ncbi:hypothetical protein CBL_05450 [Carabus blaptoides fortunei]